MSRSIRARRLPLVLAWLAVPACALESIDDDLVKGPSTARGGSPGSGGRAPSSGGNGLERPPGSAGRSAGSGGAGGSPAIPKGSGSAATDGGAGAGNDSVGGTASAAGRSASAGRPSASAGQPSAGGTGALDGGAGGTSALGGGAGDAPSEPTAPLFFSEYVEGLSNNKALELSTPLTGSMEGCAVAIYLNAATAPSRTLALEGRIEAGAVHVVCDENFAGAAPCDSTGTLSFNGNDVVALVCDGELMDVIGRLGEAPKLRWGTPQLGTLDLTLRRNCDVNIGDRDPNDDFSLSSEWTAVGKEVFDGLGTHCVDVPDSLDSGGGGAGADLDGAGGTGGVAGVFTE